MSDFKRLKIAVLCGGPSPEHEVSLSSGETVFRNLDSSKFEAVKIIIPRKGGFSLARLRGFDAAFIAMHGPFGEDGGIQKLLEEIGLPYTGSDAKASRLGMDKAASKELFLLKKVPTPKFKIVAGAAEIERFAEDAGFPIVVKPSNQGSSVGISIVKAFSDIKRAFAAACAYGPVLAEEFVDGRELTVGILIDQALPVVEIKTERDFFDYRAKYEAGLSQEIVPAPLDQETAIRAQELALRAFELLGCRGFARVDLFLRQNGEVLVSEVNTIPGLTENSLFPKELKAWGISIGKALEEIIKETLNES